MGDPSLSNVPRSARESVGPDSFRLPLQFVLRNGRECVLRAVTEDDAREILTVLPQTHAESDFLNYLPGEFQLTLEQEREYIREHGSQPRSLLMCADLSGRIIAMTGAVQQKFRRCAHHAEFGITIRKEFWGVGLGRKLTECVVAWAGAAGLHKLYLRVFADNHRAIGLYRSLGFVEEGHLRADVLRADGRYGDTLIMAKYFDATDLRAGPEL